MTSQLNTHPHPQTKVYITKHPPVVDPKTSKLWDANPTGGYANQLLGMEVTEIGPRGACPGSPPLDLPLSPACAAKPPNTQFCTALPRI